MTNQDYHKDFFFFVNAQMLFQENLSRKNYYDNSNERQNTS